MVSKLTLFLLIGFLGAFVNAGVFDTCVKKKGAAAWKQSALFSPNKAPGRQLAEECNFLELLECITDDEYT